MSQRKTLHARQALGLAAVALVLAGCSSTKKSPEEKTLSLTGATAGTEQSPDVFVTSDGTRVVRVYDQDAARPMEAGSRYVTSLGLPSDVIITPPDWIVNPSLSGVLGAIGVAPRNDLGTGIQVDVARTNGRIELAHMLEMRLQDVGRSDLEQYIRIDRQGESLVPANDSNMSHLGVQRDITDVVLSGSRQNAMWFDPTNGDCFVWMVMDGDVPQRADHSVENGVSVYIANTAVGSEYRPERPEILRPAPEVKGPVPAPPPVQKTPTQELEEKLKELESLPVKEQPGR